MINHEIYSSDTKANLYYAQDGTWVADVTPKSIAYGKTVPKFYTHIFPLAAKNSSPSLVVVWEVMQTERRK